MGEGGKAAAESGKDRDPAVILPCYFLSQKYLQPSRWVYKHRWWFTS